MFETLTDKLQKVFDRLASRGRLTEADVDVALREVRLALLEADVNFKVVKAFIERVRARAIGAGTVVITCGGRGSVLVTEGMRLEAGVYPTSYVGGTGAGDAFDAGYIAGLLEEADPLRCLQWGSALGASCVRAVGATESVFTRAEAEAFMQAHPLETRRW